MFFAIFLLACAGHDYELLDTCTASGDYTICPNEVTFEEAGIRCDNFGLGSLVNVQDREEAEYVAYLGDEYLPDKRWWAGWSNYECPAMNHRTSTTPRDCLELNPFICEL